MVPGSKSTLISYTCFLPCYLWNDSSLALKTQSHSFCTTINYHALDVGKGYSRLKILILLTSLLPSSFLVTATLLSVLFPHLGQNFFVMTEVTWKQE